MQVKQVCGEVSVNILEPTRQQANQASKQLIQTLQDTCVKSHQGGKCFNPRLFVESVLCMPLDLVTVVAVINDQRRV